MTIKFMRTWFIVVVLHEWPLCIHALSFPTLQYFDTASVLQQLRTKHRSVVLRYRDDTTFIDSDINTDVVRIPSPQLTSHHTLQQQQIHSTISVSRVQSQSMIVPMSINSTTIAHMIVMSLSQLVVSTILFSFILLILYVMKQPEGVDFVARYSDAVLLRQQQPGLFIDWKTMLLLGCGGAFPLIYTSRLDGASSNLIDLRHTDNNDNTRKGTSLSTGYQMIVDTANYRNQMEMSQLILQLLGKRRTNSDQQLQHHHHQQQRISDADTNTSEQLSITTPGSIVLLSMIHSVTAISSEIIYRLYLPTIVFGVTSEPILSILIPAMLYGIFSSFTRLPPSLMLHKEIVNNDVDESMLMLIIRQTITAAWYSMLYVCSGNNILVPILAHFLNDMDSWTSTWHNINNQIDYVDKQIITRNQQQQSTPILLLTDDTTATITLSSEADDVCRRLFYGFDSHHVGRLNQQDVHHAIQFVLYNTIGKQQHGRHAVSPSLSSHYTISTLPMTDEQSSSHIDYTEFVRILHSIYREQQGEIKRES